MICKKIIRALAFIPVVLCSTPGNIQAQQSAKSAKWSVEKASSLGIDGKSNINSFTCSVSIQARRDTIIFSPNSAQSVSLSGDLEIDVADIDCKSPMITSDLRKTLRSDEYPRMTIRFISLQSMPAVQQKNEWIKGIVEVELAGVVRRFELTYSFSRISAGHIILNGSRIFSFADFKLTPPEKMGGLIKVKDAFGVNFQLILRAV